MEYMSVKEAAAKWGVSPRSAQLYCVEGRIEGAVKFSGTWAIPTDAERPQEIKNSGQKKTNKKKSKKTTSEVSVQNIVADTDRGLHTIMPLMNTPFALGHAYDAANAFTDGDERNIALGEYYYFSGQSEKASDIVEEYLTHSDIAIRLSACLLYAYSNLALDRIPRTRQAMTQILATAKSADGSTPPDTDFTLRV